MPDEAVEVVRDAFFPEGVDLVAVLESGEFGQAVRADSLADDAEVVFVTETRRDRVQIDHPAAAVLEVRDGKIARVEFHLDRDEAREAAGLS